MVAVYPLAQMVLPIFAWVTAGLIAPGVTDAFGKIGPDAND